MPPRQRGETLTPALGERTRRRPRAVGGSYTRRARGPVSDDVKLAKRKDWQDEREQE